MQTKTHSFIESMLNISSGFIISLVIWIHVIMPLWEIEMAMTDNLGITSIFTISAIIRSYVWRRIFNYYQCQGLTNTSE